ncbi:MAG: FHA domain-containing protein, partial [Pseudomonadota bacterium]|nr:FHA domain-containing protein [Pseudomonadota bacterium]
MPMLLTLRILSYRNQPVPPAEPGRFSAVGGTVGRSPDNALVLDDPAKYISRVHARVVVHDGAFFLEDVGGNPSIVNDRPLGKGSEIALAHGDRIVIGDYQLQAMLEMAPDAAPQLPPAQPNNA